jgi:hypothetical protein
MDPVFFHMPTAIQKFTGGNFPPRSRRHNLKLPVCRLESPQIRPLILTGSPRE